MHLLDYLKCSQEKSPLHISPIGSLIRSTDKASLQFSPKEFWSWQNLWVLGNIEISTYLFCLVDIDHGMRGEGKQACEYELNRATHGNIHTHSWTMIIYMHLLVKKKKAKRLSPGHVMLTGKASLWLAIRHQKNSLWWAETYIENPLQ